MIISGNLSLNWIPPSRNTLTAVCMDDVDAEHDMDKHDPSTNNDIDSFDEVNSQAVVDYDNINRSAGVVPQAVNDNGYNDNDNISFDEANSEAVVNYNDIDRSDGVVPWTVDEVTSPYHELQLMHFTNNYKLIAQKQSDLEGGLKIGALILKNKIIIYN